MNIFLRRRLSGVVAFLIVGAISAAPFLLSAPRVSADAVPAPLSNEELAALTKPAVVRVVQEISGTSTIPRYTIDFNNFTFASSSKLPPYVIPVDDTFLGSGFIVNPDGYILTNAHVISKTTEEVLLAQQVVQAAVMSSLLSLSPSQATKAQKSLQEIATSSDSQYAMGEALGKKMLAAILADGTFDLDQKITVLNPSSTADTLENLIPLGFPASVISVNDNYENDSRDISLIKIDQRNLPSLALGSSTDMAIGDKIYIVGFPSTAQVNTTDLLQSNFTQGVVSAIKDSDDGTFKFIQTDAKISSGSSGSPLMGSDGTVSGIVTFESNLSSDDGTDNGGDNFASAIPVELAESILAKNSVVNEAPYDKNFKAGLALMADSHCKAAIEDFKMAQNVNANFATAGYLDSFITGCNSLIASGKSLDSPWDALTTSMKTFGWQGWAFASLGVIIVLVLILFIIGLLRKTRKEEKEIGELEGFMQHEKEKERQSSMTLSGNAVAGGTITAAATTIMHVPAPRELVQYIVDARKAGMDDPSITTELRNAGWPDADITKAFEG